ncbi:uncharacterized protein KY384_008713 [Bacidia gigantensis]|uniref:uncharacterized protein n=1 Tax=Bacidia gigantensis TaxID=2732470 RepID=UPI001D0495E4|nr:uncharacterized protein KY384_008713 [Bacidia gigantensis]KAG8526513.1 hypothetical protein KY384_008713 [Bacidia gigantensis]
MSPSPGSSDLPPNELSPLTQQRSYSSRHSYHRPSCQNLQSHDNAECDHGSLSPHASPPSSPRLRAHHSTGSVPTRGGGGAHDGPPQLREQGYGGMSAARKDLRHKLLGDALAEGLLGDGVEDSSETQPLLDSSTSSADQNGNVKGGNSGNVYKSTTQELAERHNVQGRRKMYLTYYLPIFNWLPQYSWRFLQGDVVAALTMASFYIPMALSYAENLGHLPPINGLYSFVFNPFIYALLGTCPRMVVGPEAAGSLLVGTVVRMSVDKGATGEADGEMNARVAGVVTGMAGAVILIAGLTRLGFLDSVLSRPFLRGFISAIGFVIFVDQLIPEMGLGERTHHAGGVAHGSSAAKVAFLVQNVRFAHGATCAVSAVSFVIIMVARELKKRLQPKYPKVAYIPDRFVIVVLSAVFAWRFDWQGKGIDILGTIKSHSGSPFPFRFPFIPSHMSHIREAMGTSFLIALLGFFESSVAAKSLGGGEGRQGEGIQGMSLSANRELVALGVANVVGGCFMALPAFGGYGRSKVNSSTGGKTGMSSILLSIITALCVLFLLPYFYYLPKAVLSAMISVVAYSLIEEAPHDIIFFIKIRGWMELLLMSLIFISTFFYSLGVGIALGIGLSILQVIRHSTKPRIQILGKVPGSTDQFENAELSPETLEFIEGCLIVKIPEPLTFANTGDLKSRLRRLELYGTNAAHPALPRVRAPEHNSNIIFDVHGVTSIDGSGTQVLAEIIDSYVSRRVRVFFCRVPAQSSQVYTMFEKSGIVERSGGPRHFVKSVDEALKMSELESNTEYYRDNEAIANASNAVLRSLDPAPVLHFTLNRRGGPFSPTNSSSDIVDLSYLQKELEKVKSRFSLTKREVKGNRLVRKAKTNAAGGREDGALMGQVAENGTWHAMFSIGDPSQVIEVDLNMLVSDFYVITTTSKGGSMFEDFFSKSYTKSDQRPYPMCSLPTDNFQLPTINRSVPVSFTHCRPRKSSRNTLGPSGGVLGLAPSEHLSQTKSTPILKQLVESKVVERPVFSLTLINNHQGVLSVGGTAARAVELAEEQTKTNLDKIGASTLNDDVLEEEKPTLLKRGQTMKQHDELRPELEQGWAWSKTHGAEGWWQILMQAVWVDGFKILQNQALVVDINSPFILAPPIAAKSFYAAVSGSFALPPPHSSFYAFPCLNPPKVAFEIGNQKFPFAHGPRGQFSDWKGQRAGKSYLPQSLMRKSTRVSASVTKQAGKG